MSDPYKPCWYEPGDPVAAGYTKEAWDAMRARDLMDDTARVETKQRTWHETNLWNATLFSNRELPGFHWGLEPVEHELFPSNLVTENLVLSIGETLLSKACSTPIRPTLVPRGTGFETRRLVRRLNKWQYGTWRQMRMEDLAVRAFLDAFISGKGVIKIDRDDDGLCAESIFFDDLVIENQESAHRAPPTKWRIRYMAPRATVEKRFNIRLDDAEVRKGYNVEYRAAGPGWVPVVEAWDTENDRHVVAVPGALPVDREWTDPFPGILVFSWQEALSGYLGATGVETVVPYQIRQNELNEVIRDVQDLVSRPRLLSHSGSQFDQAQVDNLVARIWTYTGIEPKPLQWPSALNDLYAERERNKQECFGDFGMSQMTAQGDMPDNFRYDSSAAVREAEIKADRRFLRLWTAFERFRLDMARRLIHVMTKGGSGAEHSTVWFAGGKAHAEEITWSEVAGLEEDHYTWTLDAVPESASSVAARRDIIESRSLSGRLNPEYDKDMVRTPDLDAMEEAETAACDKIDWHIDEMENGRYHPPDPFDNLAYGLPRVVGNYNVLTTLKRVPARVLAFHLRWVRTALALINPQPAPAGPGLAPAPGMDAGSGAPGVQMAGNPALQTSAPPGVAYPAAPPPAMAPMQ